MDTDPSALKTRFDTLASGTCSNHEACDDVFTLLVKAYSEEHRHYHTLTHLAHMFAMQDAAGLNDPACQWATWFHDAVYVPSKGNNEALSAAMAANHLTIMGAERPLIERASQLIVLTKTHDCGGEDDLAHLFLDSDMAILGETAPLYAAYLEGIAKEFSNVPRFLFRRGRKAFVKELLSRDRIFLSESFRSRYEQAARRNLSGELATLS